MNRLNSREIDKMLKSAFTDAVPDKADAIIKAAEQKNNAQTVSIVQENYQSRIIGRVMTTAAALVLAAGIAAAVLLTRAYNPCATVTIENSACIEITLNRDNRPISINGANPASEKLARRIERAEDLARTVDNTLDAMRESGDLSDVSNTVLITADSAENTGELLDTLLTAAQESFTEDPFDYALLGTVASEDQDVLRLSSRYNISVGKAEMVRAIIDAHRSFSAERLCRLSVNDLSLIARYRGVDYPDFLMTGTPHGCISPYEAAGFALAAVGDEGEATAELCCGVNGLYYSVTVSSSTQIRRLTVSAVTGEILSDDNALSNPKTDVTQPPSEVPTETVPTEQPTDKPTQAPTESPIVPTETKAIQPTSPPPTSVPPTSPPPTKATEPPEPDIFTRSMYYRYTAGIYGGEILPATAREIGVRRIFNGYDTYYTDEDFPYSARGTQGGITALVFNAAQFRSLTGTDDDRFDDAYFKTRALYVYMNRDADYHWTKSVAAAYIDGSVLYIEDADAVGRYVGDRETKIHTVIYELNKADLRAFTNMLEFTEQKGE